ncbi:MAG: hypothetical protein C0483_08915 [Pirellula sp.]|nr:hypothetical protein [Pirellula sp.]
MNQGFLSTTSAHLGPYERARAAIPALAADLRFRPVSHFIRPSDPCVPKSVLSLSLDELARYSHDDLLRMPGVGPKKVTNLAQILERTLSESIKPPAMDATSEVPDAATSLWTSASEVAPPASSLAAPSDTYAQVDELQWEHWCVRIRQQGLATETLGHCVAHLRDLPRSLWFVPVQDFLFLPYGELLRLRGFGVKRVAAIVEVFRALDAAITAGELTKQTRTLDGDDAELTGPARLNIAPAEISAVDAAVSDVVAGRYAWRAEWFEAVVVRGIWRQLQADAEPTTCALIAERLGLDPGELSPHTRLRLQGISRAHRFGILTEVSAMVAARWPRGELLVGKLLEQAVRREDTAPFQPDGVVATAVTLFFPMLKDHFPAPRRRRSEPRRNPSPLMSLPPGYNFDTTFSRSS